MEWDAQPEFLASLTESQVEETALLGFQPECMNRNRMFSMEDEMLVQIIQYSSTENKI